MPAIYAHNRFGEAVASTLPPPLREIVLAYPVALHLGFQGPDVLFYHRPFLKNKAKQRGVDLHHRLADEFFIEQAKRLTKNGGALTPSSELSYVAGFLCHYLLDYHLHPSVYKVQCKKISHGKIESEFDKYLLKKDNLPYRGKNTARQYSTKAGTAEAVANVLDVSKGQAKRAIKTMKRINRLFTCSCQFVHAICHGVLFLMGADKKFGDMFRRKKGNAICDKLNEELFKRLDDCSLKSMERVMVYLYSIEEIATTEKMDKIFHSNYTGGVY